MQARSALFDLYGDHVRARGGAAPIAALVRLLAPLDIAAPAVRTAVSRMVRQGWLAPRKLLSGPGYALTPKAAVRLDDAAARIYRTSSPDWDGRWHLLVVRPPGERSARARLHASLRFLGYGELDGSVWVAPRAATEVPGLLAESGAAADTFYATHAGGPDLAGRAWDLAAVGVAYRQFVEQLRPVVAAEDFSDEDAYAARFQLVHAWRQFLFSDPALPAELLPEGWPGTNAASFFDHHATRLLPAASRFVDHCLALA
ncbi:MAG: phenylacetic acid degradation operon negative regulatory protein PaaX [Actinomycetia bacterium]|nr:phenylacetic acid degradation operon negative regulatory protein PaaX [Actinomycetes bacterium]MDQ1653194.1 phenylacetic acid degradation operon negative regulatory protein [Cryptosporangiaceae bacterium]MDQ1656958.1 phenylacetic acid degradation operon negative regulatory protein [Cryptosporangiaceae bacterium]